ncbi:baculoviral iap repeat-containing protein 7 [Plakobranchus ocellatus]|uniref:Baculoviral iap repeat-containing protein 7 n=1 Tax=Plakobranchus ocellatus TaxID=259542 RepID=A0AAV4B791_9GAST|nr:baculoviral iap repeat-containing protein 7 [Plakobranchus ocellatus]
MAAAYLYFISDVKPDSTTVFNFLCDTGFTEEGIVVAFNEYLEARERGAVAPPPSTIPSQLPCPGCVQRLIEQYLEQEASNNNQIAAPEPSNQTISRGETSSPPPPVTDQASVPQLVLTEEEGVRRRRERDEEPVFVPIPPEKQLKVRIALLEKEKTNLENARTCGRCKVKAVDRMVLPCGHMNHCSDCGSVVRECWKCNKVILADSKIFIM